ncbi:MAG: hypothetical protein A2600_10455 [Candidatus Lambdaproteobacteria bacterium RIFOXYD1_FULL_56_27]|uniref:DUF3108 domain-containing protein n=1 Tax=Candidatus Lambdaproteobacteria bacterium RIFOXYD2_FULL_56_26 TaxID=1817773 RepID=A0A1F6GQQ4_9PROT|nr:MAG: hypothetical protein A2557_09230 [Candidatus Lambdaproteobacteria bacterium RIFOXYD2_FULL_56_26]OGH04115.1 MAG: hypothetical protein A2426_02620 [Candidatus Lambdaproteobacteria bacterium RIFOXYC1_FULL_56_13]OGH06368.1 MAG: hypothetical protein A2600_10455 [Candidatus Lambdaproteobacteria bacterium RIFOXYD1_FULL_56_27]
MAKIRLILVGLLLVWGQPLVAKPLPQPERLLYRISLGGWLTLGYAEVKNKGPCPQTPHCLSFEARAWNDGWAHSVYPVDDLVQTEWDPVLRHTLWHKKKQQEGRIDQEYEVHFDYQSGQAQWTQRGFSANTSGGLDQGTTKGLIPELQDPLSAIFYARSYPVEGKPGMKFKIGAFDDLKVSQIEMSILQEQTLVHEVNGESREFQTQLIQPQYEGSGMFQRSDRKLFMWVSKGASRVTLKFQAEIAVGSIWAELIEADPLID